MIERGLHISGGTNISPCKLLRSQKGNEFDRSAEIVEKEQFRF